jgi:all-trans-nonaprenyl-diphosphate synthase
LLDITGDEHNMGKQAGSDLQGGILTAPALFVLERKDSASEQLSQLIKSRAVVNEEGTAEALRIIRDNGGIEATVEMAKRYARQSKDQLVKLNPSVFRDSLAALVDYVITRTS